MYFHIIAKEISAEVLNDPAAWDEHAGIKHDRSSDVRKYIRRTKHLSQFSFSNKYHVDEVKRLDEIADVKTANTSCTSASICNVRLVARGQNKQGGGS